MKLSGYAVWTVLAIFAVAPSRAFADDPAPPDPEVTLHASEIQALINLGIAASAAQSAQTKIRAAMAPKATPSPSPSPEH